MNTREIFSQFDGKTATGRLAHGARRAPTALSCFACLLGLFALASCREPQPPVEQIFGDGGHDAGDDGGPNLYGTCLPVQLTYGQCAVGEQFSCATWEHDHCGVCIAVQGQGRWVAFGPHVMNCAELEACSMEGEQRAFSQWNGPQLCCSCAKSGTNLSWTCTEDSSCVRDLGGVG